jgi:ABC-2 type transport system permease protein
MQTLRRYADVLPLLVRLHVRSELEYRGAFILDRIAQIITYGSYYAAIFSLLLRFGTLAGWTWPEMALLFSVQILTYSFGASVSFTQLRDMEEQVRLGTFDTLLVRPFSPWAFMIFGGFNIGYAGHVILSGALLVWSLTQVEVAWSLWLALYLAAAMASAVLINAAILTIIGASALIWVRASPLYTIFFGLWELVRFPISIYPGPIQAILLTIVPLGFATSVPVAFFLGKDIPVLGPAGGIIALFVGPALTLLAMAHWRYAISRYQGGGG